ncbi:MAG TPA: molybdate ABC transporter substrate-binding protein [Terriglobales bacterium]|nr:molybdate ABC transporter substrate-binding protein [Terriglobales bacterium]
MPVRFGALIVLCALAVPCLSQELTIAAAADLHSAMDEISARFQNENSARVRITYGSSGNFYQQIQNGAPFDIFFSANTDYPKKLARAELTVADTYYEYARGKIVLLARSTKTLDLAEGLKVLLDPTVKKVAIADPLHAPYGQAAVAALKSQNLYDKVSTKIVTGENISQAASFVLSGAADVGIIAMSLAVTPVSRSQTRYVEIPADQYPPLDQACVVLKNSKQQKLARQFESYIQSTEAATIWQRYGFEVPTPHSSQ